MGNRSYLNVWCRELSEATLVPTFQGFLATVPVSSSRPGFTQLVIRAVSHAEPSLLEHDLRRRPLDAAELAAAAGEILHADVCYEVEAHWDLSSYDAQRQAWQLGPQRLEIICQGEEYDDGAWAESGHFCVDLGFEHLFTGYSGTLGPGAGATDASGDPPDSGFLEFLAQPGKLREYQERTRENIQRLQSWVGQIFTSLPVARVRLWSEGEENFEERVDAILAAE